MVSTRSQTRIQLTAGSDKSTYVSKRKFNVTKEPLRRSNRKRKTASTPHAGPGSNKIPTKSANRSQHIAKPRNECERTVLAPTAEGADRRLDILRNDFEQYDSTIRCWSKVTLESDFDTKKADFYVENVFTQMPYAGEEDPTQRKCQDDCEVDEDFEYFRDVRKLPEQADSGACMQDIKTSQAVRDLASLRPSSLQGPWGEVDESSDLRSDFGDDEFEGAEQSRDTFECYPDNGAGINFSDARVQ